MNSFPQKFLLILSVTIGFGSCSPGDQPQTIIPASAVYATGYDSSPSAMLPLVWQNYVPIFNLDTEVYSIIGATIFVKGNDVYVYARCRENWEGNEYRQGKLYKNGVFAGDVSNNTNDSSPLFVTDHYCYYIANDANPYTGEQVPYLCKLHDDNKIPMTDPSILNGVVGTAMFIVGNDKYAALNTMTPGSHQIYLWKNGQITAITSGNHICVSYSMYVSNNDVYIAGNYDGVASLWKNGIRTALATNGSNAASVFVNGNDVYVAGSELYQSSSKAKYWKNGVSVDLTDGTNYASANSIYVKGNDVYVAGRETNAQGKYVAKIWKNGTATSLTDGLFYADAQSIFVN
jgi:hypothetical protein